jgi:protocatechuate 3,4-dioxygenase, beta subunit
MTSDPLIAKNPQGPCVSECLLFSAARMMASFSTRVVLFGAPMGRPWPVDPVVRRGRCSTLWGRVLNLEGEPVRSAKVEVWQANSYGRYTHPSDSNPAPLDPNFEGSAILMTDSEGRYRFKTIKPAAYPVGPNFIRPAHIHFQVSGRQDRLVTQMYFENDPYNDKDPFLNSAGGLKELLITKLLDPTSEFERDSKMVIFDIVLFKG